MSSVEAPVEILPPETTGPRMTREAYEPNGTVTQYWEYGNKPGIHVHVPQPDGSYVTFARLGCDQFVDGNGNLRGGWEYVNVTEVVEAIPDPIEQARVIGSLDFIR